MTVGDSCGIPVVKDYPTVENRSWADKTMADDWKLPELTSDSERLLAESLGPAGLESIDHAIAKATTPIFSKVARVVSDAMKAGGYAGEEAEFELHVRRVILLVESGALEAQGNLRRPRFSEVRLPSRR
jgi:hypothetical protein